jgi:Ca2+-binding EF-hand superfamily protein
LYFQVPGSQAEFSADFNETCSLVDFVITVIFTVEALLRIFCLGLISGETTYLRNEWNILDITLVSTTWIAVIAYGDLNAPVKPTVFRVLRGLRPLRSLRFFEALLGLFAYLPYVFNLSGFLIFFMVIYSALGVQLFGGVLSRQCPETSAQLAGLLASNGYGTLLDAGAVPVLDANQVEHITSLDLKHVSFGVCPDSFTKCRSESCFVTPFDDSPDDRTEELYYFGFDNVFVALISQLVVTSEDEWTSISNPIADSGTQFKWLVWPFFASMVSLQGLLVVNMYVSVICYAMTAVAVSREDTGETAKVVKRLAMIFHRIDTDGGGTIEATELKVIAEQLKMDINVYDIDNGMREMDAEGNGHCDFREFVEWWRGTTDIAMRFKNAMAYEEAKIRGIFDKIDVNDTGVLDKEELGNFLKGIGVKMTDDELNATEVRH